MYSSKINRFDEWIRRLSEFVVSVLKKLPPQSEIYIPVVLVTMLGMVITLAAFREVYSWERERVKNTFLEASRDRVLVIRREIEHSLAIVQDIASFFDASQEVGRREFRKFVGPAIKRGAGIQSLQWVSWVKGNERKSFEAMAREGFSKFQITERDRVGQLVEASSRAEHFPILYVQPYKKNKDLLGFDLASDPRALQELNDARKSGVMHVSARIPVDESDPDRFGFAVCLPVFHRMDSGSDEEADQDIALSAPTEEDLRGFAVGFFDVGEIVERAMATLTPGGTDISIFDVSEETEEELLYEHFSRLRSDASQIGRRGKDRFRGLWESADILEVAGRKWQILSTPIPGRFIPDPWSGWIVMIGGLAFTGLLSVYLYTLLNRAEQVRFLVDERTEQLRKAVNALNKEVSDRKHAENALQRFNETLELRVKRRTAEAERRAEELEQFAYVASHDLKAPLRGIANLADWLEEDLEGKLDEDTYEQLDLLKDRVLRMQSLIEGLLEYSRAGRIERESNEVDVGDMLEEIVDSLSPPKGFRIEIPEGLPVIITDRLLLSQVFSNLIGNSIKHHGGKRGRIWVECNERKRFYEFVVRDDGRGIAPEFQEKIFLMFQTLDTADRGVSTGIGLALVKKIVQEQGGSIIVESSEGQGASFRFTWPRKR